MSEITLYATPTSPFARRVHLALRRIGQLYETQNVETLFPPPDWFQKINPLGLVPAIKIGNEDPVFDSAQILDFLDHKFAGVWPKEFQAHWKAKRISIICTGVMLDAVRWFQEQRRSEARPDILKFQEDVLDRSLAVLNWKVEVDSKYYFGEKKTQAATDVAVALQYLKFRLPNFAWENKYRELRDLLDFFVEDEVFMNTAPNQTT